MVKKIKVLQHEEKEKQVPIEVLADSIVQISQGIKKLRSGRLNDRALMLLIQHAAPNVSARSRLYTPLSIKAIKAVFEGIESLEATYLKKK